MKKKRNVFLCVCLVLLIVVMPVFSQPSQEKNLEKGKAITLATYQSWYNDGLKAVIELYKEKTGNTIKIEVYPDDQFQNLMKTKLATGDVPDLFANHPDVAKYPKDKFAALKAPWKDKVYDHIVDGCTRKSDGQIIIAPYGAVENMGIVYNKDVLKKAGVTSLPLKTFNEFLAACEKIKKIGVTPLYVPNKEPWTAQILLLTGLNQVFKNNPGLADKLARNEIKFYESPELVAAMKNVQSLKKNGYVNEDYMSATYPMALEAIAKGEAGFLAMGTWAYADVEKDYPELVKNTGMIPFTAVNSGINIEMTGSTAGLLIPIDAKDKETAEDFINMMMTDEFLKIYYEKQKGTPPVKVSGIGEMTSWSAEMDKYKNDLNLPVENAFNLQYFPDFWPNMSISALGQNLFAADDVDTVLKKFYEEVSIKAQSNRVTGW